VVKLKIACIFGVLVVFCLGGYIGAKVNLPFLAGLRDTGMVSRDEMDAALDGYREREALNEQLLAGYRTAAADSAREITEYRDELGDIRVAVERTREDAVTGLGATDEALSGTEGARGASERQGRLIRELEKELRRLLGGDAPEGDPPDAGDGG